MTTGHNIADERAGEVERPEDVTSRLARVAALDLLYALEAALPLMTLATYEFRNDEEARQRYEATVALMQAALAKAGAR